MRLLPKHKALGWAPYFWLVYLTFPMSYLFLVAPWTWKHSFQLLGFLCFLVIYFRAHWVEGHRLLIHIGGILTIGMLMFPLNWGASAFFIYAAAFLGEVTHPRRAYVYLAILVLLAALQCWWLEAPIYGWIPAVLISVVVGAPNIHFAEQKRLRQKLIRSQDDVREMAKIAERERIRRDLHDWLGHSLSLIVIKAQLANRLIDAHPDQARCELDEIQLTARNALEEVRDVISGLGGYGLSEECKRTGTVLDTAGISLEMGPCMTIAEPMIEKVFTLTLREAITNVIRHSRAKSCTISFEETKTDYCMNISDNGVGFNVANIGFGLESMMGRAHEMGGELELSGEQGTSICLSVPKRNVRKPGETS